MLHRFFQLGVAAKGIDGVIELVGGLLLLLLPPAAIRSGIFSLVRGELKEDPTDVIANLILHSTRRVIELKIPASAFLIVHGGVKLALVGALFTNQLWSYPVAIVVFAGFTAYQLDSLAHHASLFMALVTIADVIVIALIAMEYRHLRARSAS